MNWNAFRRAAQGMACLVIVGLAGPARAEYPAGPPALGLPSLGYTYFHKTGETIEGHNAAILDCLDQVSLLAGPFVVAGKGLIGGSMHDSTQARFDVLSQAGNLENCMMVRGWEVIRLDDDTGARLAGLDTTSLNRALSEWVGSPSPPGAVVRRFTPYDRWYPSMVDYSTKGRPSLSQQSVPNDAPEMTPQNGWRPEWKEIKAAADPGRLPPGTTAIIVRAVYSNRIPKTYLFINLDDPQDASPQAPLSVIAPFTPEGKLFNKKTDVREAVLVFAVKPGRWIFAGEDVTTFCLGAPAFDVAKGEAIYAGSFSPGQGITYNPDMSLDRPKAALAAAPDIVGRLKPARYGNGATFNCGLLHRLVLYTWAIPGAPTLDQPNP